jgi:MFS family permease
MASLLGRFGPTPLTGLAFTCLVLAYAVFLRAGVHPDYPAVMLPATLLVGLAFGLGFSSLSVAATAGVPNAEQGLAASLFQTSFQVGGAVVLAIVTAVVDAGGAGRITSAAATLAAYRPALALITGIAAIGMLVALSGLRRQPVQPAEPADDLTPDDLAVGELAVGDLAPRELEARELAARGLTGSVGEDLRGGSSDSRRV